MTRKDISGLYPTRYLLGWRKTLTASRVNRGKSIVFIVFCLSCAERHQNDSYDAFHKYFKSWSNRNLSSCTYESGNCNNAFTDHGC